MDGKPQLAWRSELEANRMHWDRVSAEHADSEYYSLCAFSPETSRLLPHEELHLAGITSAARIAHLQCHLGLEAITLAGRGADVVGLDFSLESVRIARQIAGECGSTAKFVHGDVYDGIEHLGRGNTDIVFVTYGSICWLPDLSRWARVVAAVLQPGGRVILSEMHPLAQAMKPTGRAMSANFGSEYFSYTFQGRDYAGADAQDSTIYTRNWSPLEVVTALAEAGLIITAAREHEYTPYRLPWLEADQRGIFRFPENAHPRFPLMYSIAAVRRDRTF